MKQSAQFLLLLTASACVLAKDLPCNDGSCVPSQEYIKRNADLPLTRDTSLELPEERRFTQERWDAVLDALNNDDPEQILSSEAPIYHSNVTMEMKFSSGNQEIMEQYEQIEDGEMEGNKLPQYITLTTITKLTTEEGYEYDYAQVVNIYQEMFFEETVAVFSQVGEGKSYVVGPEGTYEEYGNLTAKGSGNLAQTLEGNVVLISEEEEMEETESTVQKTVVYLDLVISVKGDQEVIAGYEILTQEVQDIGQETSSNEPTTTVVGQVQEEVPISGYDGPLTQSFNGTVQSGAGESTITAKGSGYQWYTESSTVDKERIYLSRLSLRRFYRFH